MPNTKAPTMSDGPIGAIAPPKPGTKAATGTMTHAATAISSRAASNPPASPFTRKRRHAAVNENSVLRNAAPSAKPPMINAAEAGCPSSTTSASSSAVPSTAAIRNGQSRRGSATAGDESVVVLMNLSSDAAHRDANAGIGALSAETQRLLQVIPLGAVGRKRTGSVRGPVDHRAVVEPDIGAAEQFRQHEPIRRRPMTRIAVGDGGAAGQRRGNRGKLRLRFQPIGFRVIESRAVDVHGARYMAVGLRSG